MNATQNNLTTLALAKALASIDMPTVQPGAYPVDFTATVHVRGSLKKSADTEYTPTADIPLKATLALCLQYAGVTREAAAEILVRAMAESIAAGTGSEAAIQERLKDVDEAMARVQAVTAALPKKARAGALRASFDAVTVEIVGQETERKAMVA